MIMDVVFEHDRRSIREARDTSPQGRIIRIPRNFSSRQLVERIIRGADGLPGSISLLRFRGIPLIRIFPFFSDSPFFGSGRRETTPEEDEITKLNEYFVPGRTNVFFFDCGVDVTACFLRNPSLRRKLWSRVIRFASAGSSGETEVSDARVGSFTH